MTIFIDPPFWPAHETLWSHLVSDSSYDELHEFAAQIPLPRRSFDLDHYDVPASRYARAVDLGATPVDGKELIHHLRASGLRVRRAERPLVIPLRRREYLLAEWELLAEAVALGAASSFRDDWARLGAELLRRWNESHRRYHNEQHLEDVLLSLDHLATRGETLTPETRLAAWFHDAIYTGVPGRDEEDSARYAVHQLGALSLDTYLLTAIAELIVATKPAAEHAHAPRSLAQLLDADLAIFAAPPIRYHEYAHAVRSEYAHVPHEQFRKGRASILRTYLGQDAIYRTSPGHELWELRARNNLAREVAHLESVPAHER